MTAPLDPAPPPRSKRTIGLVIFLIVALLAGVGGFIYWRHASQFEETDDAYVDGNITTVSAQIAGRVSKVYASDNQDVKAGDVLAEIEQTDFASRVSQMDAALKAAQARVEAARTQVAFVKANTEASLSQAPRAGVEAAEASVEKAQGGHWRGRGDNGGTGRRPRTRNAQADVDAASAEATRRAADLKRIESIDPRAMSQQQRERGLRSRS